VTRRRATIQGGRERMPSGGSESRARRNAQRQADVIDVGPGLTIDARGRLSTAPGRSVRPLVAGVLAPSMGAPAADAAALAAAVLDLQDVARAQAAAVKELQTKLNEALAALRDAHYLEG